MYTTVFLCTSKKKTKKFRQYGPENGVAKGQVPCRKHSNDCFIAMVAEKSANFYELIW